MWRVIKDMTSFSLANLVLFVSLGFAGLMVWKHYTDNQLAEIAELRRQVALPWVRHTDRLDLLIAETNMLIACRQSQRRNWITGWIMHDEWSRLEPIIWPKRQMPKRLTPIPEAEPTPADKSFSPKFGYEKPADSERESIIKQYNLDGKP